MLRVSRQQHQHLNINIFINITMRNCHIFLARPILSLCLCYAVFDFDAIYAKCYTYRILTLSTISLQQITLSVSQILRTCKNRNENKLLIK